MTIAVLLFATLLVAVVALATIAYWPWRIEATVKAATNDSTISLAAGLDVAGVSASGAAILGGPGVLAIHLRKRQVYRHPIAHVSIDALLAWLDARASKAPAKKTALSRAVARAKTFLLASTDLADLPELGLRVLLGLREPSFHGAITCGFSDPALTGKTAAWLFPLAGVLAPFGALDVSFDWTGRTVVDGEANVRFRIVPARVLAECLRFAWHHVHVRSRRVLASSSSSSTMLPETT